MKPPIPVNLQFAASADADADWLIVPMPVAPPFDAVSADLDVRLGGDINRLRTLGDVTGKHLELIPLHNPRNIAAHRVMLVGMGDQRVRRSLHDTYAAGVKGVTVRKWDRIAICLPEFTDVSAVLPTVLSAVGGAFQGADGPGIRKAEPGRHYPAEFVVVARPGRFETEITAAFRRAVVEATAIAKARRLVNLPPNELYPETFPSAAIEPDARVSVELWDEMRLRKERMGAILGVAEGSSRPPRLLIIRYLGGGEAKPLAFVGKGVTFDSGGLSIKTSEQMADMKSDMAGGAAVACATVAAAALGLNVNLIGIIPLVENMPGGRALKLGDVLTARNGKTIEVLNTDAEGRLILSDALVLAGEQRPRGIVDLATLTGACMVALGTDTAGLMTNNEEWAGRVQGAAKIAGERVWPLPLDAEYDEMLRSRTADMKNIPPNRYGGAIAGGKFLQQFVDDVPWVHLDIAGPSWADHDSSVRESGGTGAFVRTLIQLAIDEAERTR